MTTAARQVLADCRGALEEFADGVEGPAWRRRWITAVVLLRTVGYVLKNVDGASTDKHKAEISRFWANLKSTKPNPAIFWRFIEEERNTIVHEYQTNAGQGVTVQGRVFEINVRTRKQKVDPPKPPVYHYTMNAGYYKDRDQRELIAEAIRWWEAELDALDSALLKRP